MIERLLHLAGWLLVRTPEPLLRGLSVALGDLVHLLAGQRRRVMRRNLAEVFPDRPAAWRKWVARESCRRMVETGLLAIAAPHLPVERIRAMARMDATAQDFARAVRARPRPIVAGSAHLAYWEALTWIPVLVDQPGPQLSTVYRPMRNPALNRWVVATRSRFGALLLSRRSGIHQALHILQRGGLVNVLFDQNAGGHGTLTTFFGRKISMTELPALLVSRTGADLVLIGTRRTGFWRLEIFVHPAPHDGTTAGVLAALNLAFEDLLRKEEEICASWLWLHDRWKISELPVELKKITEKRNLLAEDARSRAQMGGPQARADPSV